MKYSLINCYSDYNKGDLGIILTTVRFLQEIDKDADITGISTYNYSDPFYHTQHKLLSKSIPVSPSIFGELNIGKRKDPFSKVLRFLWDWIRFKMMILFKSTFLLSSHEKKSFTKLKDSDYIISKGGSFLCDEKNLRIKMSLRRFMMIFNLINYLIPNSRIVILCQSIGPIYDKGSRNALNKIFEKCHKVVLREDYCLREYPYIHIPSDKLIIRNDIAFHLDSVPIDLPFKNFEKMKVGMTIKSVSATQKSQYENMMKTCIEHIIDKYDVNIFIYPHVTVDDDVEESIKVYRMLADKYKSNVTVFTDNYQSGELKYLYSHMDYFIATRLHSSIFAIGEGVPSLVIAYHGTKAQGIFHNIDLDEWVVNDYETDLSFLFDKMVKEFDKEKLVFKMKEDRKHCLNVCLRFLERLDGKKLYSKIVGI